MYMLPDLAAAAISLTLPISSHACVCKMWQHMLETVDPSISPWFQAQASLPPVRAPRSARTPRPTGVDTSYSSSQHQLRSLGSTASAAEHSLRFMPSPVVDARLLLRWHRTTPAFAEEILKVERRFASAQAARIRSPTAVSLLMSGGGGS